MNLVDDSVSQIVGRSVSTSFTTIIIGIAAGTYVSLFIVSLIGYDLTHLHAKKQFWIKRKKASFK